MVRTWRRLWALAACVAGFVAGGLPPGSAAAQTAVALSNFSASGCPNAVRANVLSLPLGLLASQVMLDASFPEPFTLRGSDGTRVCNLFFQLAPRPGPLTFMTQTLVVDVVSSNPNGKGELQLRARVTAQGSSQEVERTVELARRPIGRGPIPFVLPIAVTLSDPPTGAVVVNLIVRANVADPAAELTITRARLMGTAAAIPGLPLP